MYSKPEGLHPLEMRYFSPTFTWVIAACCFFMLIAANGLVMLYDKTAGLRGLDEKDMLIEKKKVSIGLGCVSLLMVILKIMSKIYYRERLLPGQLVAWLDQFYYPATVTEYNLHDHAEGEDDDIISKEELSVGIRKMKILTLFKIATAAVQFAMWSFHIGHNNFVWIMTLVVVLPNLLEILLMIRQFFNRRAKNQ